MNVKTRGKGRLLLTVALAGGAAAFAANGTYSAFTSTATGGPQTISSGTVTIALGATGAATNRLDIGASAIVPGDTIQRAVNVTNNGSADFGGVTLTTTAPTSSVLDTDATNGLQMVIEKCSVAWTEGGTAPAYTYTCGGTLSSVLASTPVIGANLTLSNMTLTAGSTNNLRVTLTFPSGAGNTFQNKSSVISYAFTGTQRAATSR